ncbi:baseplate J/gp47 family protein [Psychromonas hadalis]|uniref:baseplate J/gp47 family protein n=1 Tax=Psychromonas hadalis TaxID=211669 RepID=UPI0003B7167F|nr:baseplate J/gp47 family protein [Psychromonas hadalis]
MSKTPSLESLIYRAKTTLKNNTGVDNPAINALACAVGGVAFGQYAYADYLFKQMHPETCNEEWLYLHAQRLKVDRISQFFATGTINFLQTSGVVSIPTDTIVRTSDNKEYKVTTAINSDISVPVKALLPNVEGNLPSGEILYLVTAVTGLHPESISSNEINGGADIENVEHWRDRVVQAFNEKQIVGRLVDYEFWAKSAHANVDYAWGLDNTPLLGQVTVYIGQRESDPLVDEQIRVIVQNYIDANRLAGCHVFATLPTLKPVAIVISGISDLTVRKNIDIALQQFFNNRLDNRSPMMANEISTIISAITTNFTFNFPNNTTTFADNELLTFGGVTW